MTPEPTAAAAASGQAHERDVPAPRFDLIGLVTGDLSASLAFYRLLGLDVPADSDAGAQPHVEAALPGGLRIAWDSEETIRSFDPDWNPGAPGGGRIGLAFRCDSPADVDTLYRRLTAAGHPGRAAPWDAVWGQRYASVSDPDGNAVDLFAALAS